MHGEAVKALMNPCCSSTTRLTTPPSTSDMGPAKSQESMGQIRDLLHMFDRSCYVGYTATPFANIFIDPDTDDQMRGEDLFPRSFIVSLDPSIELLRGYHRISLKPEKQYIRTHRGQRGPPSNQT